MKEAGAGGDAILDALASNSATYDGKTQFAQVCRLCLAIQHTTGSMQYSLVSMPVLTKDWERPVAERRCMARLSGVQNQLAICQSMQHSSYMSGTYH